MTTPDVPAGTVVDFVLGKRKCAMRKKSESTAKHSIAPTLSCLLRWNESRERTCACGRVPPRGGTANCMARDKFAPSDEKLDYANESRSCSSDMIVSGERRIHRTSVSHPNREISHGSESGRWVNVGWNNNKANS